MRSRRPTSVPSLQYDSWPSHDAGGRFFSDFGAVRTASGPRPPFESRFGPKRFIEGPETTHVIVRWRRVASTAYRASQVSEAAAKEFNIEQTLDNMLSDWTGLELQIFPYRDTGTGVLKGVDEVQVRDSAQKMNLNLTSS